MKKLSLVLVATLLCLLAINATPLPAAAALFKSPLPPAQTFTSSASVPIALGVYVPCALNGVGEDVFLTGKLHILFHFTANANGGFSVKSQFQPQGVSGVGLISGAKYQGTGGTRDQFRINGLPFSSTFVNNFRIIGQGKGNNYAVHQNFHITVNANGVMTAFVDNFKATCK